MTLAAEDGPMQEDVAWIAKPGVTYPVFGFSIQETHERTGGSPTKGHEDDEGNETSLLVWKAGRAGTGKYKAQEEFHQGT